MHITPGVAYYRHRDSGVPLPRFFLLVSLSMLDNAAWRTRQKTTKCGSRHVPTQRGWTRPSAEAISAGPNAGARFESRAEVDTAESLPARI